jgi:hypothetical protein
MKEEEGDAWTVKGVDIIRIKIVNITLPVPWQASFPPSKEPV